MTAKNQLLAQAIGINTMEGMGNICISDIARDKKSERTGLSYFTLVVGLTIQKICILLKITASNRRSMDDSS